MQTEPTIAIGVLTLGLEAMLHYPRCPSTQFKQSLYKYVLWGQCIYHLGTWTLKAFIPELDARRSNFGTAEALKAGIPQQEDDVAHDDTSLS